MNATEATSEAALESAKSSDASPEPATAAKAHDAASARDEADERDVSHAHEEEETRTRDDDDAPEHTGVFDAPSEPRASEGDTPIDKLDRKKLEEQLEALKRKELELRRALTLADHPALVEAVRVLEGRTYAVARVEAKLAQGPSKSEARRRETIGKKLAVLQEKRSELDTQIAQLEGELAALGADRTQVYVSERREALEALLVALGNHDQAFREVGLEVATLVPDLARLMPELTTLAESFVQARDAAREPAAEARSEPGDTSETGDSVESDKADVADA